MSTRYIDGEGYNQQDLVLTLITFGLIASFVIWPNDVFIANSLTIEDVFSSYLGEQSSDPLEYNCRKIVLNRAVLGCLPFVFTCIAFFFNDPGSIFSISPSTIMHYYAHFSILVMIAALTYLFFHHFTKFSYLESMKYLRLYSDDLTRIRRQISAEFRNFLNFSVSLAYSSRIIISDSWVMNFNRYSFVIVNISDVLFEAVDAKEFAINVAGGNQEVQFLRIRANVINRPIPPFYFRINGTSFRDLQDKLTQRIEMTREIILHVSPNERFVTVFKEHVTENGTYAYPDINAILEPCIGCYGPEADVKINLGCQSQEGRPECRQCFCRPMWCVSCLGRVFAGKQDQERPETWLGGQADCPTCRAPFCVRDVQLIRARNRPATNPSTTFNDL